MSEETTIVKTNNLVVGYIKEGKSTALFDPLNLTLSCGELVCFMGVNGIGKTTLIKTLAGINKPLGGEVVLKRAAGLVLTDRIRSNLMSVYDLVTFGRYPYLGWTISLSPKDHELIESAIQKVHLDSIKHKRLDELSDGQLQMAMIAKALAQDTPVLMLDEPTAHLDLNNRVEIMNLLRDLARNSGKAILIATHELDLALQTADKIWLAAGRKIIEGIPEDLVLDNTFDETFKLKGFDLKTGKMAHLAYRNIAINLEGDGFEFLWAKNALERNGYMVNSNGEVSLLIKRTAEKYTYHLNSKGNITQHDKLQEVLLALKRS